MLDVYDGSTSTSRLRLHCGTSEGGILYRRIYRPGELERSSRRCKEGESSRQRLAGGFSAKAEVGKKGVQDGRRRGGREVARTNERKQGRESEGEDAAGEEEEEEEEEEGEDEVENDGSRRRDGDEDKKSDFQEEEKATKRRFLVLLKPLFMA